MDHLVKELKSKKLKITSQRLAIYDLLCRTDAHPSAESIYKTLEAAHPSLSLATVYKTLDTFTKTGLIQELNVGEDSYRYDYNREPHPHIVCQKCRDVFDLPPLQQMDSLREVIKQQTEFIILSEQLYVYGICPDCQCESTELASR